MLRRRIYAIRPQDVLDAPHPVGPHSYRSRLLLQSTMAAAARRSSAEPVVHRWPCCPLSPPVQRRRRSSFSQTPPIVDDNPCACHSCGGGGFSSSSSGAECCSASYCSDSECDAANADTTEELSDLDARSNTSSAAGAISRRNYPSSNNRRRSIKPSSSRVVEARAARLTQQTLSKVMSHLQAALGADSDRRINDDSLKTSNDEGENSVRPDEQQPDVLTPLLQLFTSLQSDRRRVLEEVMALREQLTALQEGGAIMASTTQNNHSPESPAVENPLTGEEQAPPQQPSGGESKSGSSPLFSNDAIADAVDSLLEEDTQPEEMLEAVQDSGVVLVSSSSCESEPPVGPVAADDSSPAEEVTQPGSTSTASTRGGAALEEQRVRRASLDLCRVAHMPPPPPQQPPTAVEDVTCEKDGATTSSSAIVKRRGVVRKAAAILASAARSFSPRGLKNDDVVNGSITIVNRQVTPIYAPRRYNPWPASSDSEGGVVKLPFVEVQRNQAEEEEEEEEDDNSSFDSVPWHHESPLGDVRRQTPNFGSTPSVNSSPTERMSNKAAFDPRVVLNARGRFNAFCASLALAERNNKSSTSSSSAAEDRVRRERLLRVEIDKLRHQVVTLRGQVERDVIATAADVVGKG